MSLAFDAFAVGHAATLDLTSTEYFKRTCHIADFVGIPVRLVGVGPDRDQVVWLEP